VTGGGVLAPWVSPSPLSSYPYVSAPLSGELSALCEMLAAPVAPTHNQYIEAEGRSSHFSRGFWLRGFCSLVQPRGVAAIHSYEGRARVAGGSGAAGCYGPAL
jgi:hypothetical protein